MLALSLSMLGFFAGLVSAVFWWQASRIKPDPGWRDGIGPLDPSDANADWLVALISASEKSASLNRTAAVFTAIAVIFTTFASVVSLAPSFVPTH